MITLFGCDVVVLTTLTRVESVLDNSDNLGRLNQGQMGLIHKLNYLNVTRISHVL